jgi:nicotinate phosphoribosyltransferase
VVHAARGRAVVDFGTRRAHGPQAGVLAARSSFIGGCVGTSNVLAGYKLGIPIVGTAAHSFTMTFDTEMESFEKYHQVFPNHTILLIDTYDTIEGAKKATQIGPKLRGVRLDSGDLVSLSKQVRQILDKAGLTDVKIVASGDLNEYKIADLLSQGAPIDVFGVGTELVTSRDDPALAGVYKLVEQEKDGIVSFKLKLSSEKATYPGKKQVYRRIDKHGNYLEDIICRESECQGKGAKGTATKSQQESKRALIIKVVENGELSYDLPNIEEIQTRTIQNLSYLSDNYKRLENADQYPVHKSLELETLRVSLEDKIRRD